jgi:uncharacterized SAM-binding protein YcdF (DUF218 family)
MSPSSLIFIGLCAGAACLFFKRRSRIAAVLFFTGLLVALLSFFPPVPDALLRHLEDRYNPYAGPVEPAPEWILVLGQGFKAGDLPDTSRVDDAMYARLMEAVRVARALDRIRIIVPVCGEAPMASKIQWWESFCRILNLSPGQSVVLPDAEDTEAEIRQALQWIGNDPFILVTSASHMPRAMLIAGTFGGQAIPAPCDFESRDIGPVYRYLIPSSQNLNRTETALHEYMGNLWFRLTHAVRRPLCTTG